MNDPEIMFAINRINKIRRSTQRIVDLNHQRLEQNDPFWFEAKLANESINFRVEHSFFNKAEKEALELQEKIKQKLLY